MAGATYAIPSFLGGQISAFAQGRFDKPDYRLSLNVCLNSFPVEIGTWTRRPGTQYGSHPRGGNKARVVEFDFEQSSPVTMEFTDGWLRFRNGPALLTTNDAQTVSAISTANPAVVQTGAVNAWIAGNTVIFPPGVPLLENRQFSITQIDTTHFSLQDALTGANIDGSTLSAIPVGFTVQRVQELQTAFISGAWSVQLMRYVQAETTSILLNGSIATQAVTVTTPPTINTSGVFGIGPLVFQDGPYLDPYTNGVQVTPSGKSGNISLTLSFQAYSATQAYAKGAFVTSSSVNYQSLVDNNVNNTPVSSPTQWAAVSAGAAINNGQGFLATDIGRLVRLFSEPSYWLVGTAYVASNIVAYNPSGLPGATTYWQCLANSTGNAPGSDITHWQLIPQGAAIWSWGKITSLSNSISGTLAGSANIGSMTLGGGLAASFDGNTSKPSTTSSVLVATAASRVTPSLSLDSYIGKNYTGASAQTISSVTIYPSTNFPIGYTDLYPLLACTINLRASNSLPSSPSNGTLLGSAAFANYGGFTNLNDLVSAVTINSNNQTSTWNYVWVEISSVGSNSSGFIPSSAPSVINTTAQVVFVGGPGTGVSTGVNIEILGPALLYTTAILTWRLGVYSNTTGWPTCGCYAGGRLWLGGAVSNRFDASVSNGISGMTVNFAPTDQYGVVADNAAIDETLNSDSVNPIRWMKPDLQGVMMGTQNGEWLVLAPTAGPITPTNIDARRITKHGSANIEPVRTPHANIIIKRYARKMLEFFADAYSGKFSAPNLSDKAEDIAVNGIAEIAFTEATTPVIWGYDTLGSLFGCTYKRDTLVTSQPPDFYAWHQHTLGSGRVVESVCSGASVGGDLDALTMVTNDPTTNIRHVEVLTDISNETTTLADSWYLDDAVNPSSTSTTNVASNGFPYGGLTINGLWHLNGKTVQVFASGLDCGDRGPGTTGYADFTVTNGSITVPYGDSISSGPGRGLFNAAFAATAQIVVGFTYNSDGQLVRPVSPADTGARNGPALGKKRRIHRYAVLLSNTLGISFGTTFGKLLPTAFKMPDDTTPIPPLTTFSGVYQAQPFDDYSFDGMMCWRVSRPFPANIVAISGNIETQDQ